MFNKGDEFIVVLYELLLCTMEVKPNCQIHV